MILLASAMDAEIREVQMRMEQRVAQSCHGVATWRGILDHQEVVLMKTGVGKAMAAFAATIAVERFHPQAVIFTGLAGGLNPAYAVGDTVLATDVVQYDLDASSLGFALGEVPYEGLRFLGADPRLLALGATYEPTQGSIHQGRIGTGDRFVDLARPPESLAALAIDAVEMEGAAFALVCHKTGVPWLLCRTISDRADQAAPSDFINFLPKASQNSLAFIRHMLAGLR